MNIEYIRNPPLIRVILELFAEKDFNLKVSDTAKIYEKIENVYNVEPNVGLIPPRGKEFKVHLSTLRYKDEKDQKILEIGSNFIVFTFNKFYENWENLRALILETINFLNETLAIGNIVNFSLTYVDEFLINREDFQIDKYFNIDISRKFKIYFNDFHLGFVPYEDNNEKIVLRLKARKGTELKYRFILESVYLSRNINLPIVTDDFAISLNKAHDMIEEYFIILLKEKALQEEIGMIIKE